MGFEVITLKSEFEKMKSYDEKTTARLYLTSDKRVVVTEDDERARFLLAIEGHVTRAEAKVIRSLTNGENFLRPINTADVPDDEPVTAPPAPKSSPIILR